MSRAIVGIDRKTGMAEIVAAISPGTLRTNLAEFERRGYFTVITTKEKAIELWGKVVKTTISCREPHCGWNAEIDWEIKPSWYNVPCPRCSKGSIVNKAELNVWGMMKTLAESHYLKSTVNNRKGHSHAK